MARTEDFDFALAQDVAFAATDRLRIGAIGAGFIMREVQLPAYRAAGYDVVAVASRSELAARTAAEANGIDRYYGDWRDLLADGRVEIVDVAFPPHLQLEIVREAACHADHIRGILAQKPLATTLEDAAEIVRTCEESGIVLSVNQNMRYDQSIRALKTLLARGDLGDPRVAQILMNNPVDWQPFIADYQRTLLLNMSIHHLDCFRFLFGDPERIVVSAREDPRVPFAHKDGMGLYCLEYADGLRAVAIENTLAESDTGVTWRVDGSGGMATGTLGWPDFPEGSASTISFRSHRLPTYVLKPAWTSRWFPDAFVGTMGQLLEAVSTGGEPAITARDNLRTMVLVEAAYRSLGERRTVALEEIDVPSAVA